MERATPAKRERDPPRADDDGEDDEERYTQVLERRVSLGGGCWVIGDGWWVGGGWCVVEAVGGE